MAVQCLASAMSGAWQILDRLDWYLRGRTASRLKTGPPRAAGRWSAERCKLKPVPAAHTAQGYLRTAGSCLGGTAITGDVCRCCECSSPMTGQLHTGWGRSASRCRQRSLLLWQSNSCSASCKSLLLSKDARHASDCKQASQTAASLQHNRGCVQISGHGSIFTVMHL